MLERIQWLHSSTFKVKFEQRSYCYHFEFWLRWSYTCYFSSSFKNMRGWQLFNPKVYCKNVLGINFVGETTEKQLWMVRSKKMKSSIDVSPCFYPRKVEQNFRRKFFHNSLVFYTRCVVCGMHKPVLLITMAKFTLLPKETAD